MLLVEAQLKERVTTSTDSVLTVNAGAIVECVENYGENWEEISDALGVSEDSCQTQYEKAKKMAKKILINDKKHVMGTGGGPSKPRDDDPILDKLCRMVGPTMDDTLTETQSEVAPVPSTSKEKQLDPFTNNRANLKRPKNPKLLVPKSNLNQNPKESIGEKFKALADDKMDLVKIQNELATIKLNLEKEKLANILLEREILKIKKVHHEEMLAHFRSMCLSEKTKMGVFENPFS